MNIISIYGILTTNKIIKCPLRLLSPLTFASWCLYCKTLAEGSQHISPLTFASWCLYCKTLAVGSQHISTPFCAVRHFNLGNILMEPFTMVIGHGSHVLMKTIQMGSQKIKFQ